MTTFTAPFNIQVQGSGAINQNHFTNVYSVDATGNVTNNATKGQIITVLAATINPGNTTEVDTGFALPANSILSNVFINVRTAEATGGTKSVNVGLLSSQGGGNASGFAVGLSVAATGLVIPKATVTTGGSTKFFASTTKGVFLADFFAGANVVGQEGLNYEHNFLTSSVVAKHLSFTRGSVFSQCVADIYVTYIQI